MKNKILLTVVFASLGFAIYTLFSNLQKTEDQIYFYEGTTSSSLKSDNYNNWGQRTKVTNKKNVTNRSIVSSNSKLNIGFSINSINRKGAINNETSDFIMDQIVVSERKNNRKEVATSLNGESGMLIAYDSRHNKNNSIVKENNSYSSIESDYSSDISSSRNTFMGVPIDPNSTDDIIIDPGGDPNPEDIIPVGEGNYVLLILVLGYILHLTAKKKFA